MDTSYLNFIAYESQDFFPKIEMGFEDAPAFQNSLERVSNDFMFSLENESQSMFSKNQTSQNLIQNIFDVAFNPNASFIPFEMRRKHAPFQIIRKERAPKKEESSTSDETSVNIPIADKIASKSRRIIKREKAKLRSTGKPKPPALSCEITQKHSLDVLSEGTGEDKSKKRILQMIRNRISAQNSRDRKKAYIRKIESQQKKTASENNQLHKQIRELKQANEALKIQCEQLKRGLVLCMSDTNDPGLSVGDMSFRNDIEFVMDSGPYVKKNESMAKYSLALETMLSALMFSNGDPQRAISGLEIAQAQKIEEVDGRRKFEDISIKTPEILNDGQVKLEMEHEVLHRGDSWQTVSSTSSIEGLKNLRDTFNEKYMNEFLSQLKVKASSGVQVINQDVHFPQYVKQNQEQGMTRENSAALFCPSGFTFESAEEDIFGVESDFPVKVEDAFYSDSKKSMKLQKAEWLQLFVPKSNLHFASQARDKKFKISGDSGCDSKDNSLIELWCKIVNVKTLQAGF